MTLMDLSISFPNLGIDLYNIPKTFSIFGFDIALLAAGLSAVFLSFTLMLSVRRLRPLRYKDIFILLIALVVVLLPWIFLGGNWMAAVLFACFPPVASYIINLYY